MSTGYILYVIIYYVQSIPIYIYTYIRIPSILYAIYYIRFFILVFLMDSVPQINLSLLFEDNNSPDLLLDHNKMSQKHRNKGSPNLVPTSFQKSALLTCGVTAEESKSIKGTKGRMMFVVFKSGFPLLCLSHISHCSLSKWKQVALYSGGKWETTICQSLERVRCKRERERKREVKHKLVN